jgi:hypothetical protein
MCIYIFEKVLILISNSFLSSHNGRVGFRVRRRLGIYLWLLFQLWRFVYYNANCRNDGNEYNFSAADFSESGCGVLIYL